MSKYTEPVLAIIGVTIGFYLILLLMAGFEHSITLNRQCVTDNGTWIPNALTIGMTGRCEK